MTEAEKYLELLKHEKEVWQSRLDSLPGETIDINNPVYRVATNAANKYAVAAYMYKLMKNAE